MKKWRSLLVTFGVECLKLRHFLQINLEMIQFNSKRTLNPDQDTTKTRRSETMLRTRPSLDRHWVETRPQESVYSVYQVYSSSNSNFVYLFKFLSGEGSHLSAPVGLLTDVLPDILMSSSHIFGRISFWCHLGENYLFGTRGRRWKCVATSHLVGWGFSPGVCVEFLQVQQYPPTVLRHAHWVGWQL